MKLHHRDAHFSQYSDTNVKLIPLILIEVLKEANLSVWVQILTAFRCSSFLTHLLTVDYGKGHGKTDKQYVHLFNGRILTVLGCSPSSIWGNMEVAVLLVQPLH